MTHAQESNMYEYLSYTDSLPSLLRVEYEYIRSRLAVLG